MKQEMEMKSTALTIGTTLSLALLSLGSVSNPAYAGYKQYSVADCNVKVYDPWKASHRVYTKTEIRCFQEKDEIQTTLNLYKNTRFWAWPKKASDASTKEGVSKVTLSTSYYCYGSGKKKYKSAVWIKVEDGRDEWNLRKKFSNDSTINC